MEKLISEKYVYNLLRILSTSLHVEGDIVELGVFKGANAVLFGKFIKDNNLNKKYIGFDTFIGYTQEDILTSPNNQGLIQNQNENRWNWDVKKVRERMKEYEVQDKTEFVVGDLKKTLPLAIEEKLIEKVSFLYIDCNAYMPSKVGIDNCINIMEKGSIICIDEHQIGGETKALLDAAQEHDLNLIYTNHPNREGPPIYCILGGKSE